MKFAAFFRNTNLGRPGSPTKQQFESSFDRAGALRAESFQVNGTIVFDAPSLMVAKGILVAAASDLRAGCGLIEPACVRSMATLARLPTQRVFAGIDRVRVHELTLSFACARPSTVPELPLSNARGDARVLWLERGNAMSVSLKIMSGPGSPNRLLEQVVGVPFTSRSLGTLERLLDRHA